MFSNIGRENKKHILLKLSYKITETSSLYEANVNTMLPTRNSYPHSIERNIISIHRYCFIKFQKSLKRFSEKRRSPKNRILYIIVTVTIWGTTYFMSLHIRFFLKVPYKTKNVLENVFVNNSYSNYMRHDMFDVFAHSVFSQRFRIHYAKPIIYSQHILRFRMGCTKPFMVSKYIRRFRGYNAEPSTVSQVA